MTADEYPDAPGFKAHGPSEEAADKIAASASIVRAKVLAVFEAAHPQGRTADEVAHDLHLSILTVRPRVSELHRDGELEKTPERGKNDSGMSATVWRYVPHEKQDFEAWALGKALEGQK
ncbi:hypothetical protein [Tardiphaga sp. 841_E9_N1_2]|uniref:hypothetical protein n=1 Tax=Tardiphaga sp. 841_E9_N1_2 TaxID=3240762 RepID=UPI003F242205